MCIPRYHMVIRSKVKKERGGNHRVFHGTTWWPGLKLARKEAGIIVHPTVSHR